MKFFFSDVIFTVKVRNYLYENRFSTTVLISYFHICEKSWNVSNQRFFNLISCKTCHIVNNFVTILWSYSYFCKYFLDPANEVAQPSLLWRVSSQAFNIGSGVVGAGVGSIKWAASTTYNVGSGVLSATQTVVSKVVPSTTPKPKND